MTLSSWRISRLHEFGLYHFYYFSLIENLGSIIKYGILPKNTIEQSGISAISFAEETVQEKRHNRIATLSNGLKISIHNLAPVYIVPRTPTLSSRRNLQSQIFFVEINSRVIADDNVEFAFTDGNAASQDTIVYKSLYKLDRLPWEVLKSAYWNDFEDGKRKRNAEFLIYPSIPTDTFERIVVNNKQAYDICSNIINVQGQNIQVAIDQSFFFL